MKTRSPTHVARTFNAVLDRMERDQEEMILVRNRRPVARLAAQAVQRGFTLLTSNPRDFRDGALRKSPLSSRWSLCHTRRTSPSDPGR